MRVIFCRSSKIGSWLIRALTFSKWSHVALVIGPNAVIEATWPNVRLSTITELISTHTVCEMRELPITADQAQWVHSQIGKPYDLGALFAVLMPYRAWTTDDKWFCSELIASATGLFIETCRVSPQMLYLLSRPAP